MTILQIVRDNLSNLARRGKEQRIKQDFRSHILTGLNAPYKPFVQSVPEYRETIFGFHTRRHHISLNLMKLINEVKKENNSKLAYLIERVVGDFSYIPNSNSYCVPMIRLQIQSASVLMQQEDFVNRFVDMELENQRLEQKIKDCCALIKKKQFSQPLTDLAIKLETKPDLIMV